ncbi:hypothetical protein CEXT_698811 [Caerostris extrusa]|uniref:Uncharacterized protein n=1 Tax=Caerostris extrusa TaxID=172846 RepID=A0AAV4PQN9_CAEEX|nr:hypothetical protein CEXT_698811 [Caerostris extrusa]
MSGKNTGRELCWVVETRGQVEPPGSLDRPRSTDRALSARGLYCLRTDGRYRIFGFGPFRRCIRHLRLMA